MGFFLFLICGHFELVLRFLGRLQDKLFDARCESLYHYGDYGECGLSNKVEQDPENKEEEVDLLMCKSNPFDEILISLLTRTIGVQVSFLYHFFVVIICIEYGLNALCHGFGYK